MEAIKQVIQGVHDDLQVRRTNYAELASNPLQSSTNVELQEKWTSIIDQVEESQKPKK
jgi:hypothetical protein